jgi:hypothetical protein
VKRGLRIEERENDGGSLASAGSASTGSASPTLEGKIDNKFCMSELRQLKAETAEQFCDRIDLPKLLGRNFLGPEEWKKGFGVDVGRVPPIPASVTRELLNSECPLHPGQKIKDTHVLMLVPKTVNGEPYTPLKLDELCAKRKGSGDKLIWGQSWKSQSWTTTPQAASEWVLIPKSDPDPKVSPDKHFRSKNIAAQQAVHDKHYPEYRKVKVLEVMTLALLNDLVNGEPRVLDGWNNLRCEEPNASGGRVCLGRFEDLGIEFAVAPDDQVSDDMGYALARKL